MRSNLAALALNSDTSRPPLPPLHSLVPTWSLLAWLGQHGDIVGPVLILMGFVWGVYQMATASRTAVRGNSALDNWLSAERAPRPARQRRGWTLSFSLRRHR